MPWGATEVWLVVLGLILGVGLSLSLLLVLARRATATTADLDEWDHFERTLDTELERARRDERPLTMVRIPLDTDTDSPPGRSPVDRIPLRRLDHAFVLADAAYLIAPGTGIRSRAALLERILAARDGQHPSSLRAATFPDDGLSSGALRSQLDGPPSEPSGRAPITDRRDIA